MLGLTWLSVATAVISVILAPEHVTGSTTGGLIKRVDIADGTELRILPLVSTSKALPSAFQNREIFPLRATCRMPTSHLLGKA